MEIKGNKTLIDKYISDKNKSHLSTQMIDKLKELLTSTNNNEIDIKKVFAGINGNDKKLLIKALQESS